LNKLMAALPGPMRAQAATMRERLHIDATGWRETGEDLSMLAAVQDAVARERTLAFDYTRADGQKGPRTVDPLGLVAKGASWYLVARASAGIRTYRVSRMESVTVLASGFERPAHFDLAAYWKRSGEQLEAQRTRYPVVFALAPDPARKLIQWLAAKPIAHPTLLPEGWCALQADFETEQQARFVALGFGAEAKVLEPQELRARMAAEILAMAGMN
jgi:predicted DNA-binding transcriptional regulator YafY